MHFVKKKNLLVLKRAADNWKLTPNIFQILHNERTVPSGSQVGSRRASQTTEKSFNETPPNQDSDLGLSVVKVALPERLPASNGLSNMRVATTMPEISSIQNQRLPPLTSTASPEKSIKNKLIDQMTSSQSEHALSMHNIGLHNENLAAQETQKRSATKNTSNITKIDRPMDLDQTTMIGSALDLDSLSGDDMESPAIRDVDDEESRISTGAGSQVGLLKMSYTAA